MIRNLTIAFYAVVLSLMSGCASDVVNKPTDITLESAMVSVGTGLAGMKAAEHSVQSGLIPSEVVITFNVAASASDSQTLAIAAASPTASPVAASASGSIAAQQSASRGNQVTLTLTNLLWAPPTVLAGNPDTLDKLLTTLKNHGYDFYLVQADADPAIKTHLNAILKANSDRVQQMLNKSALKP